MQEHLNPDKTYNLSAFIYVDRFFYGLFEDQTLEHQSSFTYVDQLDLKRQLVKSGLTTLSINKAAVISCLSPSGMIEYDDFNFHDYHTMFKKHYPEELITISSFLAHKLKEQKLYSAFAIPKSIEAILKPIANELEICHVTKVLADYLTKKKTDSFLVLINEGYCSMLFQSESITNFSNTFRIYGDLDPVYYIKKAYEALNLDSSQPCYVFNQSAPNSYLTSLSKHISNLNVIPQKNLDLSEALLCV
jgi:hypothetical protein